MIDPFLEQTKWKFSAHGHSRWFVKGLVESPTHVVMKGFLWGLYLPDYPNLLVEVNIGDRYKPDVIALDEYDSKPIFWGECGQVSPDKLQTLFRRYRYTHFAIAKWSSKLKFITDMVAEALQDVKRDAPVDVLIFPQDSGSRFVDADGNLDIRLDEMDWHRFEGDPNP